MTKPHRSSTLDWTAEDEYWRMNYRNRPYTGVSDYDCWEPAYRYGYESAQRYPNKAWDTVDPDLRSGWDRYEHRRHTHTTWEQMKDAVRDAWDRIVGDKDRRR
jgi:hypothetical protein